MAASVSLARAAVRHPRAPIAFAIDERRTPRRSRESFGECMKGRLDTSEIVVGLDIGTTKVAAVVGEVDSDGITVLGVGNVPCRGLRKGVVSNIDWTVR